MQHLLEKAAVRLVMTERFYAELLMLTKVTVTTDVRTLGINITDGVNLYINPHFWNSLGILAQVDALKHEFDHVLKNHFSRWQRIIPNIFEDVASKPFTAQVEHGDKFMQLNLAGDYENNEYLPNLPKVINYFHEDGSMVIDPETGKPAEGKLCFVSDLQQQFPDVKSRQHLEYYYEFLEQNQPVKSEAQVLPDTLDDHSLWQKGNQNADYVAEKVKQVVNKAYEATKAAGQTPSNHILKAIHNLNQQTKDWRQDLQRFHGKLIQTLSETTRKVRNRRYGLLYPGYRKKPKLRLALAIDTSASMDDEILLQIHAELKKIHSHGVDIWVIQCDTELQELSQFNPKKPFEFKGRGGTKFKPIFDAANDLDIDGLVVFSDMDNYDVDEIKQPKYDVLWAAAEGCTPKYNWGWRTTFKLNRKTFNDY